MELAIVGCALAWSTVLVGVTLAVGHSLRKRPPNALLWAHPILATATLVCLWVAVALWPGSADQPFNLGTFLITVAFVAGAFMFSLRVSGLRLPILAIGLHGVVAIIGGVLLIVGL